ncbi:ABC transporter permease [Mesorhizobium sp. CN2-181]|uniref:ABC transporter permease n=1 Tax=Mesorhizobium yinganensis TaxID=3157707 RepID=UPI0032B7419E
MAFAQNDSIGSNRRHPAPRAPGAAPTIYLSRVALRRFPWSIVRRSITPILLIAIWQYASLAGWVDPSVLAPPSQVWATFVDLSRTGEILTHVFTSLQRVLLGLAIGGSVAVVLGVVSGLSRFGEEAIDPPLQMIRAMPSLGTAPLLVIWLGIDEGVKVGLVAIGVVFPLYINLYKGIRGIDPRFAELARMCGASRRELLSRVILPGALPSALVGLRLSLGIAWLSLVIGEGINAQGGIGYLVAQGRNALQTDWIILGLVLYAILGLLMEALVRLLEKRLLPWNRSFLK